MSDSLCLMTCFHLQHTWDLPAESPGCVMLLRANLGSKLLLSINYWGEKKCLKRKSRWKNQKRKAVQMPWLWCLFTSWCLCCFALSRFVNTPRSGQRQHHQQDIYGGFGGLLHPLALLRPPHLPQCSVLPSVSHSFPCKAGWFWWRAAGCTKSLQVKNAQSSWHFQERLEWKPELV